MISTLPVRSLPVRSLYARISIDMAIVLEIRLRDVELIRRCRALGMRPIRIQRAMKRVHARRWGRVLHDEMRATIEDMRRI